MALERSELFYENKYLAKNDPWDYAKKAVEILKYEAIIKIITGLKKEKAYNRVLEVGCSKGQFSIMLNNYAAEIYAIDISETAVQKAQLACSSFLEEGGSKYFFEKGNASSLSYRDNFFDLILLSDGINEWFNSDEDKIKTLNETWRVLKPGGFAVISDYQSHRNFENYLNTIKACKLKIAEVHYLYDRFCYQFNSWFKLFDNTVIADFIYRNITLAKFLETISKLFGKKGAKHLIVIGVKE